MNRTVYLIVSNGEGLKPKWKDVGTAYQCKDGSHNILLFMFPGLTFNCRLPKSVKESRDAAFGTIDETAPEPMEA
jgi:hypothetical protein